MNKLCKAIREIALFGIVGGIVTACIAGAMTSVELTLIAFEQVWRQYPAINSQVFEDVFEDVFIACIVVFPAGFIMGIMAALTRSWTFGAMIVGFFSIGGPLPLVFLYIVMVGMVMDSVVGNSRWLWIRHLRYITDASPLKDLPVTWRISLGVGLPMAYYIFFGIS